MDCTVSESAIPNARHTRERFFKYTSAPTAVKILEGAAVRYSSPLLFNDPFDVQSGLHFDFAIESLPDKILQRIEELVASDTKPNVSDNDPWGEAILFIWRKKATHGFLRERVWETCRPLLDGFRDQILQFQVQYQQSWNDFLPRLRVFSVAEEKDNLLLWAHYGQAHTGVVFEFLVLSKEDNGLCVAQPVIYRNAPPSLFTEQEWLDDILGARLLGCDELNQLYAQYACVKSNVWAYEKEWRVWDLRPHSDGILFSDYPLRAKEIGSVYLGCRIAADSKERILSLVSKKYPAIRVFQAHRSNDQFMVDFDAI